MCAILVRMATTTTRQLHAAQQQAVDFLLDLYGAAYDVTWTFLNDDGNERTVRAMVRNARGQAEVAMVLNDKARIVSGEGDDVVLHMWDSVTRGDCSVDIALALGRRMLGEELKLAPLQPEGQKASLDALPQADHARVLRICGKLREQGMRRLQNGQALRYTVKVKGKIVVLSNLVAMGTDLSCIKGIEDNAINRANDGVFTDPLAAIALATELKRQFNTERVEVYVNGAVRTPTDNQREHDLLHTEMCTCEEAA